jgi:hypothetical protein
MARLYRTREAGLAPARVFSFLEQMKRHSEYDPSLTYRPDDRIRHPEFGPGRVVETVADDRIRVQFRDGATRLLCHRLVDDPYWAQRSGFDYSSPSNQSWVARAYGT